MSTHTLIVSMEFYFDLVMSYKMNANKLGSKMKEQMLIRN